MKLLKKKAVSFLITLIILFISVLIYTLLLYNGKINTSNESIYRSTLIIGAAIFFIYGLLTGVLEKRNGFISSILSTTILLLIIIIVKFISKSTNFPMDFIKYLIYILASGLGGIVGVNIGQKKKLKRK